MKDKLTDLFDGLRWKGNIYRSLLLSLITILILYSVCRVGFYLFNYDFFTGISFKHFLYLMYGGIRFDISAIFYINSLYILLFVIPMDYRFNPVFQRIAKYWFVTTNAIGLGANVSDFIYYRFILRRTTADVFRQFENEQNLTSLFFRFLYDYWYALLFWCVLVFALIRIYKWFTVKGPLMTNRPLYYISGMFGMLIIAYFVIVGMRGAFGETMRPITISNAAKYVDDPREISIVINTPFAIFRTLGKTQVHPVDYMPEEKLANLYSPLHDNKSDSTTFRYNNVVIIILESFSKEFFGAFNKEKENGNYKGYTPFLDSLIQHSKTFEYSYANGRKSIDGLPSVVSSIPSLGVPFFLSPFFGNKFSSLGTILKEKGYHTSFFHGAPNGSMGFEAYMNVAGFEQYYGMTEYDNDDDFDGNWGIWDEPFFNYFAEQTNTFKQPFVTAIFSVSSHHPFLIPEEYNGMFDEGSQPIHKCIQYTDQALKKYFQKASTMPWYDSTLFVITADHCSSNYKFKESRTAWGLYSIPVIYFKPDNSLAALEVDISQQIDIMPSVLGYLGYSDKYLAFGRDIFREDTEPFAFNYRENVYQFLQGDYILMFDGEKAVGFYDFKNDIMQEHNLIDKHLPTMDSMALKLKAIIQQYNNRMVKDQLIPDPDRLIQQSNSD